MKNEKTLPTQVLHWFGCYLEGYYAENGEVLAEVKRALASFSKLFKEVEDAK